jgi:hypothetical protein
VNKADINLSLSGSPTLCTAAGTLTFTTGTITLNTYTLSTGILSSNNSNTRVIAFGTGSISITGSNVNGVDFTTATNFTYTGTSSVNFTASPTTGTRRILFGSTAGATESNALNYTVQGGTDTFTLSGTNTSVRNINYTGFSGTFNCSSIFVYGNFTLSSTLTMGSVATITFAATSGIKTITTAAKTLDFPITFNGIGGTFAFQDALTQGSTRAFTITNGTVQLKSGVTSTVGSFVASNANTKYLQSTTSGSQATISQASGTIVVSDLTIQDSNAAGGASWNAYADYENTDAGNNDGWNFSLSPSYATYEPPIIIRSFTQPRRF